MSKRVLVTGASSGIGRDIAREFSKRGYDLVIVARDNEKLQELKEELKTKVEVIATDLSVEENCIELFNKVGYVDILINNAGFGIFGKFSNTDLNKELNLINTNVVAVAVRLFFRNVGAGVVILIRPGPFCDDS